MYSTDAILLSSIPSGEADEFASYFTKEFGKIRLRARSAKKIKTKQGNFMHMPSVVRFSFVAGKSGYIMSGIADEKHYPAITSDLIAQAYVLSFFHLCDDILYNEEKDSALWKLMNRVLDEAENAAKLPEDKKKATLWKSEKDWLMSLLDVLGLKPKEFTPEKAKTKKELDLYIQDLLQQAFERRIDFFGLKAHK
ncbi:MAG: recombination protein O N-terminal domain-containing protein [Candidatus Spechtbacterales bacterium]|nr:recombination protein O N-terminal domain-containing protein [Candidatus Spechtbacterales bacterium]